MVMFTSGELEEFERIMKGKPNFDKRRLTPDTANGDCYRCDQFDRKVRKCRFSFCIFDDLGGKNAQHR